MSKVNMMDADSLDGAKVVDLDGDKVGKVSGIYLDTEGGRPTWAAVSTGMFGNHETLIPLANATATDDGLTVPYQKDLIKSAPHHDPDTELSVKDEDDLYAHYNVGVTGTATAAGARDSSGPNTDTAMTRSEERLQVGTQNVETGRARLVKRIVTENVTTTVPVSHEEVVVTREPITEANRGQAMSGKDLSTEEAELTLHEERVVVGKETVPVERVALGSKTVTEQRQVDEQVRKEVIDVKDDPTR